MVFKHKWSTDFPPEGHRIPQPIWLVMFMVDLILSAGLAFYGHAVYQNSEDNLRLTCSNAAYLQKSVPEGCEDHITPKFLRDNNIPANK